MGCLAPAVSFTFLCAAAKKSNKRKRAFLRIAPRAKIAMRRVVGASFAYGVTADQFVCKLIKFDIMDKKRDAGYYWVKPKSTVNEVGTGYPNIWGVYYYFVHNDGVQAVWLNRAAVDNEDWIDEIDERRILNPDEQAIAHAETGKVYSAGDEYASKGS